MSEGQSKKQYFQAMDVSGVGFKHMLSWLEKEQVAAQEQHFNCCHDK